MKKVPSVFFAESIDTTGKSALEAPAGKRTLVKNLVFGPLIQQLEKGVRIKLCT